MVSLLAKLFNKDPSDTAKQRQAIGSACGVIGIGLNLLLFAMKLVAASATGADFTAAGSFAAVGRSPEKVATASGCSVSEGPSGAASVSASGADGVSESDSWRGCGEGICAANSEQAASRTLVQSISSEPLTLPTSTMEHSPSGVTSRTTVNG